MRVNYFSILILVLLFNNCATDSKVDLASELSEYIINEMFMQPTLEEDRLLKVKTFDKYYLIDSLSDVEKRTDEDKSHPEEGEIKFDLEDLKARYQKYFFINEKEIDTILQQNRDLKDVIIRVYEPFYQEKTIIIDIDAYFNSKSGIMERVFIDSKTFKIESSEQRVIR